MAVFSAILTLRGGSHRQRYKDWPDLGYALDCGGGSGFVFPLYHPITNCEDLLHDLPFGLFDPFSMVVRPQHEILHQLHEFAEHELERCAAAGALIDIQPSMGHVFRHRFRDSRQCFLHEIALQADIDVVGRQLIGLEYDLLETRRNDKDRIAGPFETGRALAAGGFAEAALPEVNQIFVRIGGHVAHRIDVITAPLHPDGDDPTGPEEPLCWNDKTSGQYFRAVITGNPGSGKTWLLTYETWRLASQSYDALWNHEISVDDLIVPIFFDCIEVSRKSGEVQKGLVDLAVSQVTTSKEWHNLRLSDQQNGSLGLFADWIGNRLGTGKCIVILDALDDVPFEHSEQGLLSFDPLRRQDFTRRLGNFCRTYPQVRILISDLESEDISRRLKNCYLLRVLPFDDKQIKEYANARYGVGPCNDHQFLAALEQVPAAKQLARTLRLLELLYDCYRKNPATFCSEWTSIFDEYLDHLIGKRVTPPQEVLEDIKEFICVLAYTLKQAGICEFKQTILDEKIKDCLPEIREGHYFKGWQSTKIIERLKNDGVFVLGNPSAGSTQNDPVLKFIDTKFHDFLADKYHVHSDPPWIFVDEDCHQIVGREEEMGIFKAFLDDSSKRIYNIYGVGGIGKTAVFLKFKAWCKDQNVPYAFVTGDEPSELKKTDILFEFHKYLDHTNNKLIPKDAFTNFEAQSEDLRAVENIIQGYDLINLFNRSGVQTRVLKAALAALGTNATRIETYMRNQSELNLFQSGISKKLTSSFIAGLHTIHDNNLKVILLIDTYEMLEKIDDWLYGSFVKKLPPSVKTVIFGRDMLVKISPHWRAFDKALKLRELPELKKEDAILFLRSHGLDNEETLRNVYEFTTGFPLALVLVVDLVKEMGGWKNIDTVLSSAEKDHIARDLLDTILRQEKVKEVRSFLEKGVVAKSFDPGLVACILDIEAGKAREIYDRIARFSFVRPDANGLRFHDRVREILRERLKFQDNGETLKILEKKCEKFNKRRLRAASRKKSRT
ncbi:MAG: hypothetical protein ACRERU_03905 [Methylococcales bacterium]